MFRHEDNRDDEFVFERLNMAVAMEVMGWKYMDVGFVLYWEGEEVRTIDSWNPASENGFDCCGEIVTRVRELGLDKRFVKELRDMSGPEICKVALYVVRTG